MVSSLSSTLFPSISKTRFLLDRINIALLFFFASLAAVSAQEITVDCQYGLTIFNEYYCFLQDIEVTDPAATVTFGGTHVGERTENDVEIIIIFNSTTPFMIPEMFTTFPNVNDLTIENCHLESIEIPEFVQLYWLDVYLNNITRISSNSFRNQSILFYLFLEGNNIETVDEDAFDGIGSASFILSLYRNNIRELAPRTFHSLTEIFYLDLEGNSLESISAELFSQNVELGILYLDSNQINEVEPGFADNFIEYINFIGMLGNICVDQEFILGSNSSFMIMNNALFTCYNNFSNGTTDGSRRLGMEYQGPLRIFDEFGHIISTV